MKFKEMMIYNLCKNKGLPISSMLAFLGVNLVFIIIHIVTGDTSEMQLNMYSLVTVVFFMLGVGLANSKIDVALANGVSRKTMFVTNIVTAVIYALTVAVTVSVLNIAFSQIDGVSAYGKYVEKFQSETIYCAYDYETDAKLYEISKEEYTQRTAEDIVGAAEAVYDENGTRIYFGTEETPSIENAGKFNMTTVFDILLMFVGNSTAFAAGWFIGALFKLMSKVARIVTLCVIWGINIVSGVAMGMASESGINLLETGFGKFVMSIIKQIVKVIGWVNENFAHQITWNIALFAIAAAAAFIPTIFLKPKKAQS